jgi:hypothetical protein
MTSVLKLAALAALAAVVASIAPTFSALNGKADSQYIGRVAAFSPEGRASKMAEPGAKSANSKETDVTGQKEAEARTALQSSQLQFLYTYYIWMEFCSERFAQFDNAKAGLREVVKGKESGFSPEQADSLWNVTAEKFQQLEGVLQIAGAARLYADCDQNGRYVEGLLTLASRPGGASPLPRRKDF